MKVINGRTYNLWQQFWDQREDWKDGKLVDTSAGMETTVTDIIFEENGEDSAMFGFRGEDFECWFDVRNGGVGGGPCPDEGGICFATAVGSFYVVKPDRTLKVVTDVHGGIALDEVNNG